jgi:hypothetical protein
MAAATLHKARHSRTVRRRSVSRSHDLKLNPLLWRRCALGQKLSNVGERLSRTPSTGKAVLSGNSMGEEERRLLDHANVSNRQAKLVTGVAQKAVKQIKPRLNTHCRPS